MRRLQHREPLTSIFLPAYWLRNSTATASPSARVSGSPVLNRVGNPYLQTLCHRGVEDPGIPLVRQRVLEVEGCHGHPPLTFVDTARCQDPRAEQSEDRVGPGKPGAEIRAMGDAWRTCMRLKRLHIAQQHRPGQDTRVLASLRRPRLAQP